jgi:PEGA domain
MTSIGARSMAQAANSNRQVFRSAALVRTTCVVLVLCSLLPGCVRRRLTVRSNPPGALVYVDNQQIGTTPCSVDFTYYGTREIRLIKPGFETLTVNQPIPTPWYQIPGIDFISENLVPTKIRDNRTVMYDLAPQLVVPREQLLDRANQLRQEALQFPVQPAAAVGVGGVVVPAAGPVLGPPSGTIVVPPAGAMPQPPAIVAPPPSSVPFPPASVPSGGTIVAPPQPMTTTPVAPQIGPPIVSPPLR